MHDVQFQTKCDQMCMIHLNDCCNAQTLSTVLCGDTNSQLSSEAQTTLNFAWTTIQLRMIHPTIASSQTNAFCSVEAFNNFWLDVKTAKGALRRHLFFSKSLDGTQPCCDSFGPIHELCGTVLLVTVRFCYSECSVGSDSGSTRNTSYSEPYAN
mgnify:CR=1 FL=1